MAEATDAPEADAVQHPAQVAGDAPRRPWLALALLLPAPTIGTCAAFWWWPGWFGTGVYVVTKIWAITLPLWWSRLVDRQPWNWSPLRHGGLGMGWWTGLAILAGFFGLWFLAGPSLVDVEVMRGVAARSGLDNPWAYLGGACYWITINSVLEEYVFRWFVYRQLAARLRTAPAVLWAAVGFAAHHGVAMQIQSGWIMAGIAFAGTFVGGAIWSWLYARYRSIWPGYLSHALADVGVFGVGALIIFG